MLKAKGLDVIGLMIGDAITKADHNFKAELNALIKSLGIRNNIFMPGFRSDIPDLLAVSDCILIPSSEGLSLAALEAMSAKTRVVSVDRGGSFELLNMAGCGTFFDVSADNAAEAVVAAMREQNNDMLEIGYRFCNGLSHKHFREKLKGIFDEG